MAKTEACPECGDLFDPRGIKLHRKVRHGVPSPGGGFYSSNKTPPSTADQTGSDELDDDGQSQKRKAYIAAHETWERTGDYGESIKAASRYAVSHDEAKRAVEAAEKRTIGEELHTDEFIQKSEEEKSFKKRDGRWGFF